MNQEESDSRLELPFLRNIGMVITYKCQVQCPHCIIDAGPNRKEKIGAKDIYTWIRQIAKYRNGFVKGLSLTGGEPFFNRKHLKTISNFATSHGLFVSAVTNAFWAQSKEKAVQLLQEFESIRMLSISADVHHQLNIPFERVENAIWACQKLKRPYTIAVCTENKYDGNYKALINKLEKITSPETILTTITFPVNRALKKIDMSKYVSTKIPPIAACSSGNSPVIFPDGRVIACIGPVIDLKTPHPLILGNLRFESFQEIMDKAEANPILHAIRIWGPQKLVTIIKQTEYKKYLPISYIKNSICNACYGLMGNEKILEFIEKLIEDEAFQRKIAYARVYYLKETQMIQRSVQGDLN